MKLHEIVEAYPGIQDFIELKLPFIKSKKISEIYYKMKKEVDFYQNENMKIVKTYAKKDEKGNPKIVDDKIEFENFSDKEKYLKEIEDLKNTDINFIFDKVFLSEEDVKNIEIAPKSLVFINRFISI